MEQFVKIVMKDPAVDTVVGSRAEARRRTRAGLCHAEAIGANEDNADSTLSGIVPERHGRRCNQSTGGKLAVVPGATLFLQSAQDLTIGGRLGQAQYQYTLQGEDLNELNNWGPLLLQKCATCRKPRCKYRPARSRIASPVVLIAIRRAGSE